MMTPELYVFMFAARELLDAPLLGGRDGRATPTSAGMPGK
jgi:hypothetical protein